MKSSNSSVKKHSFRMNAETKSKTKRLIAEGEKLEKEKKKLIAKIGKMALEIGDPKRNKEYFTKLHDLELKVIELEERSTVAYLEVTRLWEKMLQRKEVANKVPDAWEELDRMIYKRERIRQIERDIQLEQFVFWAKTGAWVTP